MLTVQDVVKFVAELLLWTVIIISLARTPSAVCTTLVIQVRQPDSVLSLAVAAALRDGLTQPLDAKGCAAPSPCCAPPSLFLPTPQGADDAQLAR